MENTGGITVINAIRVERLGVGRKNVKVTEMQVATNCEDGTIEVRLKGADSGLLIVLDEEQAESFLDGLAQCAERLRKERRLARDKDV